jgi:hypothetical protein
MVFTSSLGPRISKILKISVFSSAPYFQPDEGDPVELDNKLNIEICKEPLPDVGVDVSVAAGGEVSSEPFVNQMVKSYTGRVLNAETNRMTLPDARVDVSVAAGGEVSSEPFVNQMVKSCTERVLNAEINRKTLPDAGVDVSVAAGGEVPSEPFVKQMVDSCINQLQFELSSTGEMSIHTASAQNSAQNHSSCHHSEKCDQPHYCYKALIPLSKLKGLMDEMDISDVTDFRCDACSNCTTCRMSARVKTKSLQESFEQEVIEKSVHLDTDNDQANIA